jgi:regulator of RNase E activity RraA
MKSILDNLEKFSSQNVIDAMSVLGWQQSMISGSRPLIQKKKLIGVAVTLGFVYYRSDLLNDIPKGANSPEYQAFELCNEDSVLVASSVGPWESIGGDIKFLRLFQKKISGLVTDGSVRDSESLSKYNFSIYAHSFTAKQGPGVMLPFFVNQPINCGGVLVRPGDIIIGDNDGVVVLPEMISKDVLEIMIEREQIELVVKEELSKNPGSPGKYYPFNDDTYKLYEENKKNKK